MTDRPAGIVIDAQTNTYDAPQHLLPKDVPNSVIDGFTVAAKRFDSLDFSTSPRSQETINFLLGNPDINNPLSLVRPKTLTSIAAFFEETDLDATETATVKVYDPFAPPSKDITKLTLEKKYVELVRSFEDASQTFFETLNQADPHARFQVVQNILDQKFNPAHPKETLLLAPESEPAWLAHMAFSAVQKDDISVIGKTRTLELLRFYGPKTLADSVSRYKRNSPNVQNSPEAAKLIDDAMTHDPKTALSYALAQARNGSEYAFSFLQNVPLLDQSARNQMFAKDTKHTKIIQTNGEDVERVKRIQKEIGAIQEKPAAA